VFYPKSTPVKNGARRADPFPSLIEVRVATLDAMKSTVALRQGATHDASKPNDIQSVPHPEPELSPRVIDRPAEDWSSLLSGRAQESVVELVDSDEEAPCVR
jgi:hypothetical protein